MSHIVWLASYPKSGNTWMRMLLAAYQRPVDQEFDFESAIHTTISDSNRKEFEEVAGKEDLSDIEVDVYREALQRRLAERLNPPVVVKTHNARARHNGYPLIRRELTLGAIYILRNPLDIVESFADHWGRSIDHAVTMINNQRQSIGGGAGEKMIRQYLQNWSLHVRSWTEQPAFPTHVVRYEDLLERPGPTFHNVLTFLGWRIVPERLRYAIESTQFEKLQLQESDSGFRERSKKSTSGQFFRQGKSNAWSNALTPKQAKAIVDVHNEMMISFGYQADLAKVLEQNEESVSNSTVES